MTKSDLVYIVAMIGIYAILNGIGLHGSDWRYWVIGGLAMICRFSGRSAEYE